jgi:hypothetical protein
MEFLNRLAHRITDTASGGKQSAAGRLGAGKNAL